MKSASSPTTTPVLYKQVHKLLGEGEGEGEGGDRSVFVVLYDLALKLCVRPCACIHM